MISIATSRPSCSVSDLGHGDLLKHDPLIPETYPRYEVAHQYHGMHSVESLTVPNLEDRRNCTVSCSLPATALSCL